MGILTDGEWAVLAPLIEAFRPHRKTQHHDLWQTIEAIVWRCRNGAKWRSVPAELGPWWRAAQTFICWGKLRVWERLLAMAQEKGVRLGRVPRDGTTIRAHAKAAGAKSGKPNPPKGDPNAADAARVKRLAALVAAAPAPDPIGGHEGVRDLRRRRPGDRLRPCARTGA